MKKMLLVLSVALMAPTMAEAQISADRLGPCSAGEVQVCHKSVDGSWWPMIVRGDPAWDCSIESDAPIALQCVDAAYVCGLAKNDCRDLGERWRWSESTCDCVYQGRRERDGGQGGGNDGGSSTFGAGVAVAVPRCTETDLSRLAAELDRIWEARTVVEDFGPLQDRAVEVYSILVECDDGSPESRRLIDLAANMAAAFEEADPAAPDYTDELGAIRDEIAGIEINPVVVPAPEEENWCTDTVAGVFTCIVLPVVVIGTGLGVGGALLYDYLDDGSPNGILHW